jgi:hypothetical protein
LAAAEAALASSIEMNNNTMIKKIFFICPPILPNLIFHSISSYFILYPTFIIRFMIS